MHRHLICCCSSTAFFFFPSQILFPFSQEVWGRLVVVVVVGADVEFGWRMCEAIEISSGDEESRMGRLISLAGHAGLLDSHRHREKDQRLRGHYYHFKKVVIDCVQVVLLQASHDHLTCLCQIAAYMCQLKPVGRLGSVSGGFVASDDGGGGLLWLLSHTRVSRHLGSCLPIQQ